MLREPRSAVIHPGSSHPSNFHMSTTRLIIAIILRGQRSSGYRWQHMQKLKSPVAPDATA